MKTTPNEPGVRLHVCMASNNAYVQHLCVTIASVLKNTTAPLAFHILHADISDASCNLIGSLFLRPDCSVEFLRMDKAVFGDSAPGGGHAAAEPFFRLAIADMKPDLKKAIYLDSDLVVLKDLAELWGMDTGGCYAGVVEDLMSFKNKKRKDAFERGRYFNSGVMLLNLERIRQDFRTSTFLELAGRNRDWIRYYEQDVVNMAFKNNVIFLPLRWNLSSGYFRKTPVLPCRTKEEMRDALGDPGIVHYTGPDKPWVIPCGIAAHPLAHEYFRHLAMTPFAGQAAAIRKRFGVWRRLCIFVWFWWRHPGFFLRPAYWRNRQGRLFGNSAQNKDNGVS